MRLLTTTSVRDMTISVNDNLFRFHIPAETPDEAARYLEPELNRLTGIMGLRLSAGRRITWEILDATFDGMEVFMPSLMLRIRAYFYDLPQLEHLITRIASELTALPQSPILDQSLRYFKLGEELFALIDQVDRPRTERALLEPSCFLQYWKAVVTILGDPSRGGDYQSRHRVYGLPRNYYVKSIQPLHDVRNNYDVAHIQNSSTPDIATLENAKECRRVAVEVIEAYVNYLLTTDSMPGEHPDRVG